MRRLMSYGLGLALVAALGVVLYASAVHASAPQSVVMQREESPCLAEPSKNASPRVLLKGERTKITMRVMAVCAGEVYPLHIVLVLDRSGSMEGAKIEQMKDAASELVRRLKLADHPNTRVGVVAFHTEAQTLAQLTNQEARVISAIRKIQAGGGTAIDKGIAEGLKNLIRGRREAPQGSQINEVMVVLSDGQNNAGCPPVLQAAGAAKGQGVLLITICVGNDCDAACMRQAASSARYFFQVEDGSGLLAVFERIRKEIMGIVLKRLVVKDTLPDNMRYIDGSAEPQPKTVSPNKDILEWDTNFIASSGVTYTFWVEPLEPGYWPTNVGAQLTFWDNKGRSGSKTFEIPWVQVLAPKPVPTRTLPPPTSTVTPSPTPTHTPPFSPTPTPTPTNTPTPTPTNTPTPTPTCIPQYWYSDVALVMDLSTSMRRTTPAGRSKLTAALEAAKYFVSLMNRTTPDLNGDYEQVAIVGFNRSAWIEQPLTNNKALAIAALDRLPAKVVEYTRLDLAVDYGAQATSGPNHRPKNQKVIVLLTDGLPNQVPVAEDGSQETTVLRHAQAAREAGNWVYTIGLGERNDILERLLLNMASDPSKFYYMANAEDLKAVYAEIYGSLGCQ